MSKFFLYYSGISSVVFIVASGVFFGVYANIQGGLWAGAAAFVAAKCFVLHCLHFSNKMYLYYKSEQLNRLTAASFVIILITSTFLVWYIFTWVYWKILLMMTAADKDVETSTNTYNRMTRCYNQITIFKYDKTPLFPLVFCLITGKWSVHMHEISKKYSKYLNEDYSPISTQTV